MCVGCGRVHEHMSGSMCMCAYVCVLVCGVHVCMCGVHVCVCLFVIVQCVFVRLFVFRCVCVCFEVCVCMHVCVGVGGCWCG